MSNLLDIQKKLKNAKLVAVTKSVGTDEVMDLYNEGQRDFGENRVQELIRKQDILSDLAINWHFIGPLQRNKVKKLLQVENLKYIHSIDSLKLVDEIIKHENDFKGESLGLFLEFNTSGESEKHGFETYDELILAAKKILPSNFKLMGLMTLGKIRGDDFKSDAISSFKILRELKERLEKEINTPILLSMGMSQDYVLAIEEGSDFVRVGRALF